MKLNKQFEDLEKKLSEDKYQSEKLSRIFQKTKPFLVNLVAIFQDKYSSDLLTDAEKIISTRLLKPLSAFVGSQMMKDLNEKQRSIEEQISFKEKLKMEFFRLKQMKQMRRALGVKEEIQKICKNIIKTNREIFQLVKESDEFRMLKALEKDELEDQRQILREKIDLGTADEEILKRLFREKVGKCNSRINEIKF